MTNQTAPSTLEEVSVFLTDMKSFVESQNHADWTAFNQAKKTFLDTLKNVANSSEKQKVWKNFTEVADAARAIRKAQEEEGEFAAEMIAKALDGLEGELARYVIEMYPHHLFQDVASFSLIRGELSGSLHQFKFMVNKADQIQSLRDELAKTGMRLSIKGRLFDRLSKVGDQVFPVRKAGSIKINELFKEGLLSFCKDSEKEEDGALLLFQIRVIQSFLKEMILKKADYDFIKKTLDPIWKKACLLKDKKEVLQLEQVQKSEELKKTFEESFEQMKQFIIESNDREAFKVYDALAAKLKNRELLKNDFRTLKTQLETISKPLFDRLKDQRDLRQQEADTKTVKTEEKKQALLAIITGDSLPASKKEALNSILTLNLQSSEIYIVKYIYFKALNDCITDVEELENVYFEVKQLQETIRGQMGTSGLDFSKSMMLQDAYDEVKKLLNDILKRFE